MFQEYDLVLYLQWPYFQIRSHSGVLWVRTSTYEFEGGGYKSTHKRCLAWERKERGREEGSSPQHPELSLYLQLGHVILLLDINRISQNTNLRQGYSETVMGWDKAKLIHNVVSAQTKTGHCATYKIPNIPLSWLKRVTAFFFFFNTNFSFVLTLVCPCYRWDLLRYPVIKLLSLSGIVQSRVSSTSLWPPPNHLTETQIL